MRNYFLSQLLVASIASICFYSCGKDKSKQQPTEETASIANVNSQQGHLIQTKTFFVSSRAEMAGSAVENIKTTGKC
jgi:hypothetical protein